MLLMCNPAKHVRYVESLIQKISGLNCITATAIEKIMTAAISCGVALLVIRKRTMHLAEHAKWSVAIL